MLFLSHLVMLLCVVSFQRGVCVMLNENTLDLCLKNNTTTTTRLLWQQGIMGGLDDEQQGNDGSVSESNSKWMKEDQNQNLLQQQNTNPNQNSQRRHQEKNKALKSLCSELHDWSGDEALLIYSSADLKEKHEEQKRDETEQEENFQNTEPADDVQRRGDGAVRNACLLFGKNGAHSDEDSSCMSMSQGSTASSTPDGEPGKRLAALVIFFLSLRFVSRC